MTLRRNMVSGLVTISVFVFAIWLFPAADVRASHCEQFTILGPYNVLFENYESHEYVDNLLVLHLKLKSPDNVNMATWLTSVDILSDTCADTIINRPLARVVTIPGSGYYSVRFTSPTHFDIWNDETNTMMICEGCSQDLPERPENYEFIFKGVTEENLNSFYSSSFRIQENIRPDPVIIVPGILESWLHNGKWELDPILHTFDNLWDALEAAGYEEGRTLFFLGYDFRQSNVDTARELKNMLIDVKAICGCTKVDLVAHSMGGLITRQYIESDEYAGDIDQMIFLGTPHLGSPKAYLAWEGGELSTHGNGGFKFADIILQGLFDKAARKNDFSNTFDYIHNKPIQSVRELLPIYDYIIDESSGAMRLYPNAYPENIFLENLNLPGNIGKLFDRGIRMTNVVGSLGQDSTVGGYVTIPSATLPKWEHGYPNDFYSTFKFRGMLFEDGDKTVPFRSAGGLDGIDNSILSSNHQDLVTDGQRIVIKELSGAEPSQFFAEHFSSAKALIIQIFSPISISVTDPLGRVISADLNNVPDAFYTGPGDEQFLIIPDPIDGIYRMSAVGTGSGEYSIVTNFVSDTTEASTTVSGTVAPDIELDYTINIAADALDPVEASPVDITAPVTTETVEGALGENGWFISDVFVSLAADDGTGVGVSRIEYSLDGGITWQLYVDPVVFTSDGSFELLYRSIDFVGNQEEDRTLSIRVDQHPPEAVIHFDPGHRILQVEGIDISSTTVSKSDKVFIVRDEAGHSVLLNFSKLSLGKSRISAVLSSIQYEGGSPIVLNTPYSISYSWVLQRDGSYKNITQKISLGKSVLISAMYNSSKQKTVITLSDGTSQELAGLVLIRLQTNQGSIDISY